MSLDLPEKVGRPEAVFTGYAETKDGRWKEDYFRQEWRRLLKEERHRPLPENSLEIEESPTLDQEILRLFKPDRLYLGADIESRYLTKHGKFKIGTRVEEASPAVKQALFQLCKEGLLEKTNVTNSKSNLVYRLILSHSFCRAPNCGAALGRRNAAGVCKTHSHSLWCECPKCEI